MNSTTRVVTQKDVALRAGISRSMVARSLTGHPTISAATREKVLQAARELGYDPEVNQGARALIGRRHGKRVLSGVLAIMQPHQQREMYLSPYFRSLMEGMGEEADALGLDLCYLETRHGRPVPRLLVNGGIDAVIAIGFEPELRDVLAHHGVPLVGLTSGTEDIPCVLPDGFRGMYLATQHLLDLGHRQIGFVSHEANFMVAIQRYHGWKQAMEEAGAYRPELEECTLLEMRLGPEAMLRLQKRVPHCTAIVCYNDLIATDIICDLGLRGYEVPRDISVVGFDDTAALEQFEPALTSIAYDRHAMARRAVALAAGMAANTEMLVAQEPLFAVTLMRRATTARAPHHDFIASQEPLS